jgi:iron(III) transport system substrate-binding protein
MRALRSFVPLVLVAVGCTRTAPQVVVYTALDREFSEPLFAPFEKQSGIRVRPNFDTEATKTVGLANRIVIEAEGGRPHCDLFWNNEILQTLRLRAKGLLRPIHPANAEPYPREFKAADGTWYGFAARARVLIVNTELVAEDDLPRSIFDLTRPEWKGRLGIAKPLFGTTATHAACLFAELGPERARRFFLDLKANGVQILAGNKQVARSVADGALAVGFTDTDDAIDELEKGMPVRIVYPEHAGRDPRQPEPRVRRAPGRLPAEPRGRDGAGDRA